MRVLRVQVEEPGLAAVTTFAFHVVFALTITFAGRAIFAASKTARTRIADGIVAVTCGAVITAWSREPRVANAVTRLEITEHGLFIHDALTGGSGSDVITLAF